MIEIDERRMRMTLRQLGAEASAEDRLGFEQLLDLPLRLLAAEFRSRAAFRRFVMHKLEQAQERERLRRIAAIFEAA